MKEELTTEMHSEFQVDKKTEIRHTVWSAMNASENPEEIKRLLLSWEISLKDFNSERETYPAAHPYKNKALQ